MALWRRKCAHIRPKRLVGTLSLDQRTIHADVCSEDEFDLELIWAQENIKN